METPLITDWIQAIAASISLIISVVAIIYVKKTLDEQMRINELQLQLLDIESRRAAREVRPVFVLEYYKTDTLYKSEKSPSGINVYYYKLTCLEFKAKGICIEILKISEHQFSNNMLPGNSMGMMLPNESTIIACALDKYKLTPEMKFSDLYDEMIVFRIHYLNVDNRPDYQDFQVLTLSSVSEHYDSRHTNYPSHNVLANWIKKSSSDLKPIGYGYNEEVTAAFDANKRDPMARVSKRMRQD